MPKSQHPAAKAGRLVRAVGLGLAKEIEKRAEPQARPAPPPPPPPAPTRDFAGRTAFGLFVASTIALVCVVIKAEKLVPESSRRTFELAVTIVLVIAAFVQLTNWREANQRIVQRLLTRIWGPRGPVNRREKTFARICREALIVVGIAWLAAAVFELLIALGVSDATVVG